MAGNLSIDSIEEVRELARRGALANTLTSAGGPQRTRLTGATYAIAWPVVFSRLTQKLELRRGHMACAASVRHLADDCLDRFEDDVEAVVEDVRRRAGRPIDNLEAWIASRLIAATVDGHRRRRGAVGALQRPRVPKWLAAALGDDRWLIDLATQMLEWVGTTATAGHQVWPTESWSVRRCEKTGDWSTCDLAHVHRDIERVLDAMRQRPDWYANYVERPLGHKQAPAPRLPHLGTGSAIELPALPLGADDAAREASLLTLAQEAVLLIEARLRCGEPAGRVVAEVIQVAFGTDDAVPDSPPFSDDHTGERVMRLLRDPAELDRIVRAVLAIVA